MLGGSPVSRHDKTKGILDEVRFEAPSFFFLTRSPWKYILMKSKLSGLEGEGGRPPSDAP